MNARPPALRALCLAALVTCAAAPGAAQQQRVTGSRARLTPPAGYVPATRFAGFENEAAGAAIMVTEMEVPAVPADSLDAFMRGMADGVLTTPGMTLRDSATVRLNGAAGLWLDVVHHVDGAPLYQQVLLTTDGRLAFMVVGTLPAWRGVGLADAGAAGQLRAALLTLDWVDEPVADVFEGLPFRVDVPTALRGRQRLGGAVSLSEGDGDTPPRPEEALVVIGTGTGAITPESAERRMTGRVQHLTVLDTASGFAFRETEVGGRTAYELTASALHAVGRRPVRVYLVVIPQAGTYYFIMGVVGMDREAEWMGTFGSLARSFREVPAPAPGGE